MLEDSNKNSRYKPIYTSYYKWKIVEQVSNCKYLGTIIDDKLKFEINVESVYKKADLFL